MKKKSVLILTLILFNLCFIEDSFSFRSETDGYNNFKWGTDLKTFLSTSKSAFRKIGSVYYGDNIKGVDIDIGYEFFNDILYGVLIDFPPDKRDVIVDYFTIKHGAPSLERGDTLYWLGLNTKIMLNKSNVEIVSKKLEKEFLSQVKKDKNKEN